MPFKIKHGHTGESGKKLSPTYITWISMKQRCTNKNHHGYKRYGGRGINFCERWNDFNHFIQDMGERPLGKTLDRIDNEKGYCKENCKWSTPKEQCNNTKNSPRYVLLENGITLLDASIKFKIPPAKIKRRIRMGWTFEETIGAKKRRPDCNDFKEIPDYSRTALAKWFRSHGCTYQSIADHLGYTKQRIYQLVNETTV